MYTVAHAYIRRPSRFLCHRAIPYARRIAELSIAVILYVMSSPAYAVDIDPGDYLPPKPGTNLVALYGIHTIADELKSGQNVHSVGTGLEADAALLRMVHFTRIGGLEIDPQIFIPFGDTRTKLDGISNGSGARFGDIAIASSAYLINKQGRIPTVFGITPFLYMPTGHYDRTQPINQGENRWKGVLQVGLVQGITQKITFEFAGDVTFYGRNKRPFSGTRSLRQNNTYQIQALVRYNLGSKTALSVEYSATVGGKTYVDDTYGGTKTHSQQIRAFASTQILKKTNLELGMSRDIQVDDGYRTAVAFRLRLIQSL